MNRKLKPDVVEYSESEICDLIEKVENFERTLKARIKLNKKLKKEHNDFKYRFDEITLAQLDAENSLCNLLLVLLEEDL